MGKNSFIASKTISYQVEVMWVQGRSKLSPWQYFYFSFTRHRAFEIVCLNFDSLFL